MSYLSLYDHERKIPRGHETFVFLMIKLFRHPE
uniref:Uncharacterized protein n=1 Tax=Siphoviridae sp. ctnpt50 TaxID=2827941 RepID=A0A8S5SE09_9CAUD|nr:MAG TPA: hypothetical protein [Siphoviridae sp. ctnpt50]